MHKLKLFRLLFFFIFLAACSPDKSSPLVFRLDLQATGLGSGQILSDALVSNCEASCSTLLREGDRASFRAVAQSNSSFVGWEGACSGTGSCEVSLSEHASLKAVFEPDGFLLRVETSGQGLGFVKSEPLALNCIGLCEEILDGSQTVRLSADASVGSSFVGWAGACTGMGACDLSMDSSKAVVAFFDFDVEGQANLQLSKLGTGAGRVFSTNGVLECGDVCYTSFDEGSGVTLKAEAAPGSVFVGWGSACTGTADCQLLLTSNARVTAEFKREQTSVTAKADLRITEVGIGFHKGDSAWLELFNASNVTLDLSDYQLRTHAVQRAEPFGDFGAMTFDLPALWLAPNEYVFVAGAGENKQSFGPKQVYLSHVANTMPHWGNSGFVELLRQGKSVDFVRFGDSKVQPLNNDAWSLTQLNPLSVRLNHYGQSWVRDSNNTDSNSAADWRISDFATAAGPNDVPANTQDADADGIPDSAEVSGGRFAGLDLYAMGARVNQRDIFVEIDHMHSNDEGINPQREALDKVVAAFAKKGFALHFDVGPTFSATFSRTAYNLGAGNSEVPFAKSIGIPSQSHDLGSRANFYDYKGKYLDIRRRTIFHYLLLANSQKENGQAGSSGVAELNGNDLVISMGNWGLNTENEKSKNTLINFQASTLMHELGHNLGLKHGGDEHTNRKPNYYSVMNYLYQLYGLGDSTGDLVGDRYYAHRRWQGFGASKTFCDLKNSPCSATFKIDYSNGQGAPLVENSLNENIGIGRGTAWLDYDNNGSINTAQIDVNSDTQLKTLSDHDDWSNLFLPFQQTANGNHLRSTPTSNLSVNALANDQQSWIVEDAPPAFVLQTIK